MVKLHKVTMWVVDPDEEDTLEGMVHHISRSQDVLITSITETRTAEFDREWEDEDPLNNVKNLSNHALLENMMEGAAVDPHSDSAEDCPHVLYQSAVSGLWYANPLAAGDIAVVKVAGVSFEAAQRPTNGT